MLRSFFTPANALSLLAVFFWASATMAQTVHVVTNTDDAGAGSLRQAILDAAPGEEITFEESLMTQSIVLTTGALSIGADLTITGPGVEFRDNDSFIIIDGNDVSRVFEVQSGVVASISKLIVSNGYTETNGGGLWIGEDAEVTLNHVAFRDNEALDNGGAIYNSGGADLTIAFGSIVGNKALGDLSPNGGGLYNAAGFVRIDRGEIAGNESVRGGGIWNTGSGVIELMGTVVEGNKASLEGGGIYNNHKMIIHSSTIANNEADVEAGGIRNRSADSLLIVNSTISSNEAPTAGGLYNFRASNIYIYNSTIVQNRAEEEGAGIVNEEDGAITLYSTILAANVRDGSVVSDVLDQSGGRVTSEGFNFIGARGSLNLLNTDQSGTTLAPFNPQLEPLAENNTAPLVHVPRSISLVIDRGECMRMPLFFDQSGFLRLIDIPEVDDASDGCDVGSVEYSSVVNVATEEEKELPALNRLSPAYPNPFNSVTSFSIQLEREQEVSVELYDVQGRKVNVIYEGFLGAEEPHVFNIDASALPNGIYVYRVVGTSLSLSRTVVYVR